MLGRAGARGILPWIHLRLSWPFSHARFGATGGRVEIDDQLGMVRRLVSVIVDQGLVRQLEDTYGGQRPELPPKRALDGSLQQLLPRSEYEALATQVAIQSGDRDGCLQMLYESLADGLEARWVQRQGSVQEARRQHLDPVELAQDLGGDLQLASSHRGNGEEAALWLDRFGELVRLRTSSRPTPSGRRFITDQVAKALRRAQSDFRATGRDQAETQAAWCQALLDRLPGARAPSVDEPDVAADEGVEPELDRSIDTTPVSPSEATSRPTLDRLRSATSSLGDDDSFATLVEVTNDPDDGDEHTSPPVREAMQRLLDDQVLRYGDRPQAEERVVREELWRHMVMGYRIGRFLLQDGRPPTPAETQWPPRASSRLVAYVDQAPENEALGAIMNTPDFSAALHYHMFSAAFLQSCDGNKGRARAWVSLVEDCGFLVAVAEDDLLCSTVAEDDSATTAEPSHTRGDTRDGERR